MTFKFNPTIIGFLCNWCSYTGADLAGVARLQYPPNLRPIRVMCTGMVYPELVIEAFASGADGVMIMGCHPGECHYLEGNTTAMNRAQALVSVFKTMGIDPQRFSVSWISSAEASVFAQKVTEFTQTIIRLGPHHPERLKEKARIR